MTTASSFGSGSGSLSSKPATGVSDQFPVGLRVLVVDDDVTCLKILEQMLRRCSYHVTTCSQATSALNLLRERKGGFDVVLSDVHMPDMDGFKLLELVGLEMDLPVIMMSADGRTNLVLRGIRHGACDYLIKPIREEQLKNIWQHVVRKKWNENKEHENSGSMEQKKGDDSEYGCSVNEGENGAMTCHKKRRNNINIKEEDECELESDDPSASKKPRVVWSVELHQQFVAAVNQLGIDKAVPKRILELMNVPGLTRENVASHLQKFRLYLKRLSGVAGQQGGGTNSFCGSIDQNSKLGLYGRFEIQALAASGQIPPETLAALHAELFGRPTGKVNIDHQPSNNYGQPLLPSNITKQISQPPVLEDVNTWHSNNMIGNYGGLGGQNGHLVGMLQNGQQVQKQSITVQPSRLVVPNQNQSSVGFSSGVSVNSGQNLVGDFVERQISFGECGQVLDQGHLRNIGFVGKGSSVPSRFAVFEDESLTGNLNQWDNFGKKVKQEPNIGVHECLF